MGTLVKAILSVGCELSRRRSPFPAFGPLTVTLWQGRWARVSRNLFFGLRVPRASMHLCRVGRRY
jgi:hypothetical protein